MKKRPKSPPPPTPIPANSRIVDWLVGLVVLVIAVACCGRLWLLLQAVISGRHVSVVRGRPARTFYADTDPQRYWISIGWDGLWTIALLAMVGVFAYLAWKDYWRDRADAMRRGRR
ncbi:hypothetical protein [Xanthomonas hortorum]|uniref:Transmembrane protein n=1 Tax=Xanthomonas hortorum TaxID=56454 RepID=A0AA47ID90_9XANT|nr:hypothetical protein [Xanthomonas hortorum]WAH65118.1 hypothetical protein OEG85_03795 [Xanthomonas hortorum]